jgi:hypothetical protein
MVSGRVPNIKNAVTLTLSENNIPLSESGMSLTQIYIGIYNMHHRAFLVNLVESTLDIHVNLKSRI